jgi:hypothetical protein
MLANSESVYQKLWHVGKNEPSLDARLLIDVQRHQFTKNSLRRPRSGPSSWLSPSHQSVEQFHEAHGGFAISLDPFGMADPQVVVNLLPAPGVVDERSYRARTKWPNEGLPKAGTQVLAVCMTLGQLDDCVALALQQNGEQSALRKRKGRG